MDPHIVSPRVIHDSLARGLMPWSTESYSWHFPCRFLVQSLLVKEQAVGLDQFVVDQR